MWLRGTSADGCAQALADLERPARSLRKLRALDRAVMILILELRVFAQLRECSAQRGRHYPIGFGLDEIAWHFESRHRQSG